MHLRVVVAYGTAVFAVLLVVVSWFDHVAVRHAVQALEMRTQGMATAVAATVDADALAQVEPGAETPVTHHLASVLADVAADDPDLVDLVLLRASGEPTSLRVVADYVPTGQSKAAGADWPAAAGDAAVRGVLAPIAVSNEAGVSAWAPLVTSEGDRVGVVGVSIGPESLQSVRDDVHRAIAVTVALAALALGVASFVAWRALDGLAPPAPAARGGLPRQDQEIGLGNTRFDLMAKGMQEREFIRDTFGRYVSHSIAQALLSENEKMRVGGEEREVTVLYADLEQFSRLAGRLPAAEVVKVLNEYLARMHEVIDQNGGTLLETLGDGILAVFGAPVGLPDHAERAVKCAVAMRSRLADLNRDREKNGRLVAWQKAGLPSLRVRIGVHRGRVVAGNLGSATRLHYAVIGEAVSLAARLEQLNKDLGTDILVSEAVVESLPEGGIATVDQGERPVGITPMRVFSVA